MITTKTTKTTKGEDPTFEIIGCAIEVHRLLGPGLLESAYERCFAYELKNKGFSFKAQTQMPLNYKGVPLNCGYRIDLIIEELVIVEIKAIESLTKVHQAQLLTYMKLAPAPIGLLLNFNAVPLKSGIQRFVL
jgi:GxxExxY protein